MKFTPVIAIRSLLVFSCLFMVWCTQPPKKAVDLTKPGLEARNGLFFPSIPPDENLLTQLVQQLEQDPDNPDLCRATGTLYQALSQPANWAYMDRAIVLLEKALAVIPEDVQALAYLGVARASRARDPKVSLIDKFNAAREGFRLIDRAMELDGENFALRILRGKMGVKTPAILGRGAVLEEDRLWIENYLKGGEKVPLQDQLLGTVLIGDYFHDRVGDKVRGRAYWEKAAAMDNPYNFIARLRLEGKIPPY